MANDQVGSKADWIRNNYTDLRPSDVVRKAAEQGIKLTTGMVSSVRSRGDITKPPAKKTSGLDSVSKEEYQTVARVCGDIFITHGKNLMELGKFLNPADLVQRPTPGRDVDFSPSVRANLEKYIKEAQDVLSQAQKMYDITLRRGHTYFEEQKKDWENGTLRINRRAEAE